MASRTYQGDFPRTRVDLSCPHCGTWERHHTPYPQDVRDDFRAKHSLCLLTEQASGTNCPVHANEELLFTREGQEFEYLICPVCVAQAGASSDE